MINALSVCMLEIESYIDVRSSLKEKDNFSNSMTMFNKKKLFNTNIMTISCGTLLNSITERNF